MLRTCLAACLALPAGAGMAQDQAPDFSQLFQATQLALQNISERGGADGAPDKHYSSQLTTPADPDAPVVLSQTGLNGVNIVNSDRDLGDVLQEFSGQQIVGNIAQTRRLEVSGPISVEQTGSNYANMMQGNTINQAGQYMMDGARQIVSNSAWAEGAVGSISQSGTNVANIAMAEYAIGTADQHIAEDVEQKVWNYIEFDAGAEVSGDISQSGVNIGNLLMADRIDRVERSFYGTQIVSNSVVLHGPDVPMITQSGSNIANLVVANHIGSVTQVSDGHQWVENSVRDSGGNPINSANINQTEYNYEGASNVVNMMVLRAQPSGKADSSKPVDVTQEANFPQTGLGVSGQSQTGNVVVIER